MLSLESKNIVQKGWLIKQLPLMEVMEDAKVKMLSYLKNILSDELCRLEDYHLYLDNDEQHIDIQNRLTNYFREEKFAKKIIEQNMDIFFDLIGRDIHVQKYPYVRMARPGRYEDNIGIHRDTHYGGSPYEISVHIPFVDLDHSSALGVITGSHVHPEASYPWEQQESKTVTKGSMKHKLGFLYAPKKMPESVTKQLIYPELKFGQALIFPLSLVHGQEVNRGSITRFSVDVRVVNSLSPINWTRNVHNDYYEKLSSSAICDIAHAYEKNQGV